MDIQGRVSFKKWGWAEELALNRTPLANLRKALDALQDCLYSVPDDETLTNLPATVAGAIEDQLAQDAYLDLELKGDTVFLKAALPLTDADGESVILRENMDDLIAERTTWVTDGGADEARTLRDRLAAWAAQLTEALDAAAKES